MKKTILFIIILTAGNNVLAENWSPPFYIAEITNGYNGGFSLVPDDPDPLTNIGCALFRLYVNNPSYSVDSNHAQSALSLALSAFISGNKIQIYHDESTNCFSVYIKIVKD